MELDYQIAIDEPTATSMSVPPEQDVRQWIKAVLDEHACTNNAQLTVRVVDETEMAQLNQTYRHKTGVTNVLSFPFEAPPGVSLPLLGDIVVCAPVVKQEAKQQNKPAIQHWCHMIVHGLLHLLGFDHISTADAETMEALEIKILSQFDMSNPYSERKFEHDVEHENSPPDSIHNRTMETQ